MCIPTPQPPRKVQAPRGIEMQISSPLPVSKPDLVRGFSGRHTWDLGPLLPGGEIALTFQGCWLNPGSECLQGKHLLGGGGWGFCAHTPLPPAPGPLLLTFKGASNFLSDQFVFEDSGLCPSSPSLQTLLKNKTEQNLFNLASL